MIDLTKQACHCRDWSCGLPPCEECHGDHAGMPERNGRDLCRDCWQAEMWHEIEEHENANPGALEKRLAEVAEMFQDKRRRYP